MRTGGFQKRRFARAQHIAMLRVIPVAITSLHFRKKFHSNSRVVCNAHGSLAAKTPSEGTVLQASCSCNTCRSILPHVGARKHDEQAKVMHYDGQG